MHLSRALGAVRPTARSVSWGPLAGAAAAIGVISLAARPWDGRPLSLSIVRLVIGLGAAAAAFGLDDAAAVTVASSPTPLGQRRITRLALVISASAGLSGSACLAIASVAGAEHLPMGRVLLEATGLHLAAAACAVLLGADRGVCAFAGGLLAALIAQQRFPEYPLFPLAQGWPGWDRSGAAWLAVSLVGLGTLVLLSRDPVRRLMPPSAAAEGGRCLL